MCFGVTFGVIFGMIANNLSIGIAVGISIGSYLELFMIKRKSKKTSRTHCYITVQTITWGSIAGS